MFRIQTYGVTMRHRIPAAILLALLATPCAHAQWDGGVERYTWEETLQSPPLTPRESSSRYALHLNWQQDVDTGLLYGYRGKLYNGRVDYDTNTQIGNAPSSTYTDYSGMSHEGQLISRRYWGNYRLDYVGSLGWDSWRRNISSNQIADYSIWFVRTGFNVDQPEQRPGFHGGGGLKLPIRTSEDARLDSAGLSTNPTLPPGRNVSLYAELAYRTSNYWDIVGYYDSWHFRQPDPIHATQGDSLYSIVQPQSSMSAFGLKAIHPF